MRQNALLSTIIILKKWRNIQFLIDVTQNKHELTASNIHESHLDASTRLS